jgi:hypothetical protein
MRCRNNVKVGYSLLSCVVMQHLGTWWSTLKGNTVTGVSKLFTICLDLMFVGKYMQFSLICSLSKSLVLIHLLFSLMLTYVILTLYFNGKAPRMGTSVPFAPLPIGYFQMYLYIFININQ